MQEKKNTLRPHVHRWKLIERREARPDTWDGRYGFTPAQTAKVTRRCEGCGVKQSAVPDAANTWQDDHTQACADLAWT